MTTQSLNENTSPRPDADQSIEPVKPTESISVKMTERKTGGFFRLVLFLSVPMLLIGLGLGYWFVTRPRKPDLALDVPGAKPPTYNALRQIDKEANLEVDRILDKTFDVQPTNPKPQPFGSQSPGTQSPEGNPPSSDNGPQIRFENPMSVSDSDPRMPPNPQPATTDSASPVGYGQPSPVSYSVSAPSLYADQPRLQEGGPTIYVAKGHTEQVNRSPKRNAIPSVVPDGTKVAGRIEGVVVMIENAPVEVVINEPITTTVGTFPAGCRALGMIFGFASNRILCRIETLITPDESRFQVNAVLRDADGGYGLKAKQDKDWATILEKPMKQLANQGLSLLPVVGPRLANTVTQNSFYETQFAGGGDPFNFGRNRSNQKPYYVESKRNVTILFLTSTTATAESPRQDNYQPLNPALLGSPLLAGNPAQLPGYPNQGHLGTGQPIPQPVNQPFLQPWMQPAGAAPVFPRTVQGPNR